MQLIQFSSKVAAVLAAVVLAVALAGCSVTSDGDWVGNYKTQDTQGNAMEIVLNDDGAATGTRAGEPLEGSWKAEADAVTITWSDGWITKIAKDGDKYTKTAFKDGAQVGEAVPAEKVK